MADLSHPPAKVDLTVANDKEPLAIRKQLRSTLPIVCGAFGAMALTVSMARAADNPFAVPEASDTQLAEQRANTGEIATERKDQLKTPDAGAKKCGYNMPAERKEVLKVPNPDNVKSGFCSAGKCGSGAVKPVAPR